MLSMPSPYKLYYAPDNASLIVRLVLEALLLPYQVQLVNRQINEQKSAQYRKHVPTGLIPALETPDGVLFETAAIVLWLADRHSSLAPAVMAPERGEFLSWLFFISNTLHAEMIRMFYPEYYTDGDIQQYHEQTVARICSHWTLIEQKLAQSPPWCNPSKPSVISCYLACLWRWGLLYPKESQQLSHPLRPVLSDYPALSLLLTAFEKFSSTECAVKAEGLGAYPFTHPSYPTPPEGSAT